MIAANHGRATQKVAEYLTSEVLLRALFQKVGVQSEQSLPTTFQILFSVETHDFDIAESDAEPILWRGFELNASTVDKL
jgi:hypothetical protein